MDDTSFPDAFLDDESVEVEDIEHSMEVDDSEIDAESVASSELPEALRKKTGSELTQSDIKRVIKAEKLSAKNFLFAVNKKDSCFVYLYYDADGDIQAALGGESCRFVRCTICDDLLNSRGGHLGSRTSTPASMPDDNRITKFIPSELSLAERSQVATLLGKYALDAGVPFRALESDPIQELAVGLINLGVRRKQIVSTKTLLPVRTTIATHTTKQANDRIAKAREMLLPFIEHGGAISIDYGKRLDHYLAVVCHFIEATSDGWKLRALPVGFEVSDDDNVKDSSQTFLDLLDAVELVGLEEENLAGAHCVTDEGSNVSKMAREHFKAVHCIAHILNTVAKRTFVLYKDSLAQNKYTQDELVHLKAALKALETAQTLANNVRGMRKVLISCKIFDPSKN